MKLVYTLTLITVLIACKKEIKEVPERSAVPGAPRPIRSLQEDLKDSMLAEDFANLDFKRIVYNHVDSVNLYFLRVPFKGKSVQEKFILLKLDKVGRLQGGRILQLKGGLSDGGVGPVKVRGWEGNLSISFLNRTNVLVSGVHEGYIDAFHSGEFRAGSGALKAGVHAGAGSKETVYGSDVLPEVIVVAYVKGSGVDYSTWLWLNSFFYGSGDSGSGGYGAGYYGSMDGSGGGGGAGSYGGTGDGSYGGMGDDGYYATVDETMLVDVDNYVDHPAIDVEQYLKCFDAIADAGAVCEVGIYSDIPVDNDPSKLFNFNSESPGHSFLQLKKSNADGSQVIVQNIGFYPRSNWKNILDANAVDSKMVDDGMHEFNASLKMNLTTTAFRSVIGKMKELSTMKYDMDEFNCTDFALEVFNYVRTPLQIPQYAIPGTIGTYPSNTPQGLFVKLKEMKANGDSEAGNISLPGVKGWVAYSKGPCN